MEAYSSFAQVYDMFMDNVPYEEWGRYLMDLLAEYGIADGLVLDLGCGTGKMTRVLSDAGFDMIGVDSSEEMLEIARERQLEAEDGATEGREFPEMGMPETEEDFGPEGKNILYLLQDMREFELYGTVRAAVSICDAVNYLLEEEDLLKVFRLVNNYLDPRGIFIFDLNTIYKYKALLGETVICENREEGSFIWENYYDEEERMNQYDLTLFVRQENNLYRKYEETHFQRAYELETVKKLLEEAGLEFLAAYDAFTRNPVREDSERIYLVAREKTKQKTKHF